MAVSEEAGEIVGPDTRVSNMGSRYLVKKKNLDQRGQKLFTREIIPLEDGMLFLTANICIPILGIKTTYQKWRDH